MLTQNLHSQPVPRVASRLLVLGSALQTATIPSYSWDGLPPRLHLADYDVVILNLTSFPPQQRAGRICPERLPAWQQLGRLLFSRNSEIVCLGLPPVEPGNALYQSLFWWLPVLPEFVLEEGDAIRDVVPEFAFYFDQVRRWFFYSTPTFQPHFLGLPGYLKHIHPQSNNLQVAMGAIARTSAGQCIGFKLVFRVSTLYRALPTPLWEPEERAEGAMAVESGTVIWLPPPTEIPPDEAIDLLLKERYGLLSPTGEPPTWAMAYGLPHQRAIAARIREKQQAIERLQQDVVLMQRQLDATSRYHQLLYEHRSEALAAIVADGLRSLGATVNLSPCEPSDRMWLTTPDGQEGMLLVRAHTGPSPLTDLRYLDQWIRERLLHGNWQGRGILLVNWECHKPPPWRGEPFSPKVIQAAQQFDYGLVTAAQLFQAIASHQQGQLDLPQFWQALLGSGACPLPDLTSS